MLRFKTRHHGVLGIRHELRPLPRAKLPLEPSLNFLLLIQTLARTLTLIRTLSLVSATKSLHCSSAAVSAATVAAQTKKVRTYLIPCCKLKWEMVVPLSYPIILFESCLFLVLLGDLFPL